MSLFVASLNSGSNGNCYYVANAQEAVLIDAGISCKETEKRMARIGLSMQSVKAIFISHEHTDHINGVEVLAKKYKLPVYINDGTLNNSRLQLDPTTRYSFRSHEPIQVGGLTILPFPKFHDAADPCSFVVSGNGVNIAVLTDIGSACEHVIEHFSQCHAAFLETNYDETMLDNGRYPYQLKKRIKSDVGHLSNEQALELFLSYGSPSLSHVFLSHLSRDNNSPELVHQLFSTYARNTKIVVASRDEETALYEIHNTLVNDPAVNNQQTFTPKHKQLKLF